MRVGILTLYYRTYNYGAQLQAFALQKVIEKLGHKCELIRFMWCREETIEAYTNASIDQNAFIDFSNKIPHSKRVYDANTIRECIGDYDAFVVGSDQVWGVENSMPLIKLPIMNLTFVGDEKVRIAYAASIGSNQASSKIEEVLKCGLNNFDFISMREKTSAAYISKLVDKQVMYVLDPVFLLTKKDWELISGESEEKPYIFYYTAGGDNKQQRIVDEIKDRFNLPVRQLGYINGEQTGPIEFVRMIKYAEFVVTDSFHASAFSIIFNKPFVSLPVDNVPTEKSRNVRIENLLRQFSLSDRFIKYEDRIENTTCDLCNKMTDHINWTFTNGILEEERQFSGRYLENSLRTKKKIDKYLELKNKCTGCGACLSVCPVGAIAMQKDKLGFKYPYRNIEKCIDCGRCKEVCNYSCTNNAETEVIGLQSKEKSIRIQSSSVGVFTELATNIIKNGGIVAACRFDTNYTVVHDFCMSLDRMDEYRRSKYVQSDAYVLFPKIKEYLEKGIKLLFVGTPCQTVALVAYLGNIPPSLYIVDLICGGVTAPGLWDKYKDYLFIQKKPTSVSMRHKYTEYLRPEGFPAFSMKVDYGDGKIINESDEDLFLRTRLNFYRESCYSCRYKNNNRISDITIGDFVGMQKTMGTSYDGIGTTLSIIRTSKGMELINECKDKLDIILIPQKLKKRVLDDNVNLYSPMGMKPQSYYLRLIYEKSTIERLFYEDKRWDEYAAGQISLRNLFREIKRNDLLLKAERFRRYQLLIEDSPNVYGDIYIYGAGKLGRSLARCSRRVCGFIDENISGTSCVGLPIYSADNKQLREMLSKEITVVVTPVWDIDLIKDNLKSMCPNINIVSATEILGSVWI